MLSKSQNPLILFEIIRRSKLVLPLFLKKKMQTFINICPKILLIFSPQSLTFKEFSMIFKTRKTIKKLIFIQIMKILDLIQLLTLHKKFLNRKRKMLQLNSLIRSIFSCVLSIKTEVKFKVISSFFKGSVLI